MPPRDQITTSYTSATSPFVTVITPSGKLLGPAFGYLG
jgi:hypothetical protein